MIYVLPFLLIPPLIEDLRTREIRNLYFILIFAVKLVYMLIKREKSEVISGFLGLLIAFLILFVSHFISKGKIGGGDIKILLGIAFFLGLELFLRTMLILSVFSLIFAAFMLFLRKADKNTEIPFMPFIFSGVCAALLLEVIA